MLAHRTRTAAARVAAICLMATAVTNLDAIGTAEDFRIESKVFLEGQQQPLAETLTLFSDAVVYDFLLTQPEEIAVFDPRRERLVLLDVERRQMTTIHMKELQELNANLKEKAGGGALAEFIHPQFDEGFDAETGWLTLAGSVVTYRARGSEAQDEPSSRQYQQFADWYARLNAVRPGGLPPFGRIELNAALARRSLVPEEVRLSFVVKEALREKKVELHSAHTVIWNLSRGDRERIEKAKDYLVTYKSVSFPKYCADTSSPAEEER